jgi:hypothetical protein
MQPDELEKLAQRVLECAPALIAIASELESSPFLTEELSAGQDGSAWVSGDPERAAHFLVDVAECCRTGDSHYVALARHLVAEAETHRSNRLEVAAGWDVLWRIVKPQDASFQQAMDRSAQPLPLVRNLIEHFRPAPLHWPDGADVLSCQHLMGSVVPQFEAIRQLLPGARFWELLGKPYSANPKAVEALQGAGFEVNEESCRLPSERRGYNFGAYGKRHKALVEKSVSRFFSNADRFGTGAPIVVIDDGGALVGAVAEQAVALGCQRPIICVEQTTRGLNAARNIIKGSRPLRGGFAMVNVAQSLSKLVLESALIADSVLDTTLAWLDLADTRRIVTRSEKPLSLGIIGYGSVGESIAAAARSLASGSASSRFRSPAVYDFNLNRLAAARRDGYEVARSLTELLEGADVVIAAAGGSSLNQKSAYALKDGSLLLSASSGDAEFSRIAAWGWNQKSVLMRDDKSLTPFDEVHGLIHVNLPHGGKVVVGNGGFPVNFDGSLDPIPVDRIQLTRALMVAGILQIVGFDGAPALLPEPAVKTELALNPALDLFLEQEYLRIFPSRKPGKD